jgi:hypothetical protein
MSKVDTEKMAAIASIEFSDSMGSLLEAIWSIILKASHTASNSPCNTGL